MKAYLLQGAADLVAEISRICPAGAMTIPAVLSLFRQKACSFLRRHIGRRHGRSFLPPKICSMDEFIDLLCLGQERVESRQIDNIDAVAILFDLHRKASQTSRREGVPFS